jgi:hypothetical protein
VPPLITHEAGEGTDVGLPWGTGRRWISRTSGPFETPLAKRPASGDRTLV